MEEKWEYCEHNNIPTEKKLDFLNKMGQLGWELCLVRGGNNYIFKRKVGCLHENGDYKDGFHTCKHCGINGIFNPLVE